MAEETKNPLNSLLQGVDDQAEPWALEVTLKKLLDVTRGYVSKYGSRDSDALQTIAKNSGLVFKDNKVVNEIKKAATTEKNTSKKEISKLDKLINEVKSSEKFTDIDRGSALGNLLGPGRGSLTRSLSEKVSGLENDFVGMFEGMSKSVPLFGGALGVAVGAIRNNIDAYHSLAEIGQTFGASMEVMATAVQQNGLTLKAGTNFLQKFSAVAARIGGDTLLGLQKQVRLVTKDFGNFGFTAERVADMTGSYTEQLIRTGLYQKMDSLNRRNATVEYVSNLSLLSRLTGKQADELDRQAKEAAQSPDIFSILGNVQRRLGPEAAKIFQQNIPGLLQYMQTLPEEMRGQFLSVVNSWALTGELAQNELGKVMTILGQPSQEFVSFLGGLSTEVKSSTDVIAGGISSLTKPLKDIDPLSDAGRQLTAMMNGNVESSRELAAGIMGLTTQMEGVSEASDYTAKKMKNDADASAGATKEILSSQESLAFALGELKASFQPILTELTMSMSNLTNILSGFVNDINNSGGFERILKTVEDLAGSFNRLLDYLDGPLGSALKFLADNIYYVAGGFLLFKTGSIFLSFSKWIKNLTQSFKGLAQSSNLLKGFGRGASRAGSALAGSGTLAAAGSIVVGAGAVFGANEYFGRRAVSEDMEATYDTLQDRLNELDDGMSGFYMRFRDGLDKTLNLIGLGDEKASYLNDKALEAANRQEAYYNKLMETGTELSEQQLHDLETIKKLKQSFGIEIADRQKSKKIDNDLDKSNMTKKMGDSFGSFISMEQELYNIRKSNEDAIYNLRLTSHEKLINSINDNFATMSNSFMGGGMAIQGISISEFNKKPTNINDDGTVDAESSFENKIAYSGPGNVQSIVDELRKQNALLESIAVNSDSTARNTKRSIPNPLSGQNLNG